MKRTRKVETVAIAEVPLDEVLRVPGQGYFLP